MAKFSKELRLELVLKVEAGASVNRTAKEAGVGETILHQWVSNFQIGGLEGLFASNQEYTAEFKLNAIEYRWHKELSYKQAASELGLPNKGTLFAWEKIYLTSGPHGLQDTRKGRPPKMPQSKKETMPLTREQELEQEVARLRMENAYLKKLNALVAERGKVCKEDKVRVVSELRQEYCFDALLQLAGLPRSTYYYIFKQLDKPKKHKTLQAEIHQICREHLGRYGYRRVTIELRKRGVIANHKLVMRLMKGAGLTSRVRMKKYRSYQGEIGKIAPNLIKRDFHAERPNQKWTTDITEFNLSGEKLYLSPVLDMFNGEIVTYTISNRPVLKQVTDMVEAAFNRLPEGSNLIFHSDQGWQYQHKTYQKMLGDRGVQQSMSRKGNCLDNSVMENFFGLLKSELLYLQSFESMNQFRKELITYIEYYNNKRIKCKLKTSPVEYRTRFFEVA